MAAGDDLSVSEFSVSEFKARCLELIDRVASTGEAVVLTRRGRAVVRLVAVTDQDSVPQNELRGTVETVGDLLEPAFDPSLFDVFAHSSSEVLRAAEEAASYKPSGK